MGNVYNGYTMENSKVTAPKVKKTKALGGILDDDVTSPKVPRVNQGGTIERMTTGKRKIARVFGNGIVRKTAVVTEKYEPRVTPTEYKGNF